MYFPLTIWHKGGLPTLQLNDLENLLPHFNTRLSRRRLFHKHKKHSTFALQQPVRNLDHTYFHKKVDIPNVDSKPTEEV